MTSGHSTVYIYIYIKCVTCSAYLWCSLRMVTLYLNIQRQLITDQSPSALVYIVTSDYENYNFVFYARIQNNCKGRGRKLLLYVITYTRGCNSQCNCQACNCYQPHKINSMLFCCLYHASCTVHYPDTIYIYSAFVGLDYIYIQCICWSG